MLGIETVAQLGDARSNLVEVYALLASIYESHFDTVLSPDLTVLLNMTYSYLA
jgi:hypothetical protein